jgi:trehalose/maltose hydrolase-like predicted phosphorylase
MKFFENILLIVFLSFVFKVYSGNMNDNFNNLAKGTIDSVPAGYVPPLVSNGSLNMLIDFQGGHNQKEYVKMIPGIYWAGRRYGPVVDNLVPFGHFEHEISVNGQDYGSPEKWTQNLNTKDAIVECHNEFKDDLIVETVVFTHLLHNLIVVKKKILKTSSGSSTVDFGFKYQFTPPGDDNQSPKRIVSNCAWDGRTQSINFTYEADSYQPANGIVSIFSDKSITPVIDKNIVRLKSNINLEKNRPFEITYFLIFADSMDGDDYIQRAGNLQKEVIKEGFEGMLNSHKNAWSAYWDESYVKLPDPILEKVYNTAQYHLRCNATKWSFPVGIFPTHWRGVFFGWDEMFCFQALASSNHLDISRRCPEFRKSVLPQAMKRVAHYSKPGLSGNFGARYKWMSYEDDKREASSPGFYQDHVFHMANISLSCWMQYEFSGDLEYLRTTGYPVIRECARFYVTHMVYEDSNGTMFVGKCTDLERLGPARLNPFLTTCGVIYTLEKAAKASGLLKSDEEESNEWKNIALKLKENLPQDSGRYIPYKGCKEKSVAVLAGLFPYPIFDKENQLQRNAVYDFVQSGRSSGNMYPVGTEICAWYAGKMASALSLLGDRQEPYRLLMGAAKGSGCFSELFEINEPKVSMHPWFSTASGNYIYAINQMLLQSKDDQIYIAPAVPDQWNDFSFRLACYGNIVTELILGEGHIKKLVLKYGNPLGEVSRKVIIPERYIDKKNINKDFLGSMALVNGNYHFDLNFKGQAVVID